MALPNMPSYYTTRKNIYEAAIVHRRTKENDFREKWGNTANYFHKENVAATKKQNWESDKSFQNSMDAYQSNKEKEMKTLNLKRRRLKLGEMLREERSNFEAELKGLSRGHFDTIEEMKDKSEGLRSAREERRNQLAQDLMYEHWRSNNPDIRQMEFKQHEDHVINSWRGQVDDQKERAAQARAELEAMEKQMEEERQEALHLDMQKQQERLQEEKEVKEMLKKQMEQLKQREIETAELKREEEKLQKSQWELDALEVKQKDMEQQRKKLEFGKILLRQHAAALKRKSRHIQEELEEDLAFLMVLADQEVEDKVIQSARREKAQADASWMKKVIEEQLRVEKAREAELDMLYQDEAARIWQKRENEWAKERQARERLMREVLDARQNQITDKMQTIREMQQESLERREELLQELDMANQLTRREQEKQAKEREDRKQEVEAQITARRDQQYAARKALEEELAMEKKAEGDYEELLNQEAQNLHIKGFAPKTYVRKTAWM